MAYGDFKDLARRTASDKVLKDKAFNIAENPKYDGHQRGLASMVYKFVDKKSASLADKSVSGSGVNIEVKHNEQLAKELQKPIIRNFKKRTVYPRFRYNIWGADLADKAINIAKNAKYDGYQRGLVSMVYKVFDKTSVSLADKSVSGSGVNIEVKHNEQLAKELHKAIIRNF